MRIVWSHRLASTLCASKPKLQMYCLQIWHLATTSVCFPTTQHVQENSRPPPWPSCWCLKASSSINSLMTKLVGNWPTSPTGTGNSFRHMGQEILLVPIGARRVRQSWQKVCMQGRDFGVLNLWRHFGHFKALLPSLSTGVHRSENKTINCSVVCERSRYVGQFSL